eukprot:TRINITY_DN48029_c0_g1_i1.p1 TRINITY_DN48029_c0_g1~~TRINITY_DN48029_c0_g1_i1.p1  ORF type:complete len:348 (+),score=38.00 TRINITY_DN48029_c0_g1_i1:106-1149(+)
MGQRPRTFGRHAAVKALGLVSVLLTRIQFITLVLPRSSLNQNSVAASHDASFALTPDAVMECGVPPEDARAIVALALELGVQGLEPLSDPLTLLRFYRARGKDVNGAADMYRQTMTWRANLPIHEVMAAYGRNGEFREDGGRATDATEWTWQRNASTHEAKLVMRHVFFGRLGATADGAPVIFWRAGIADYAGFVREGMVDALIKAWIAHIEDYLQAARAASLQNRQLVRGRLIIDVKGFSLSNMRYLSILRRIISLAKSHFPEISASVTVIRAPKFLAGVYSVIRPLLPDLLQEKISILGDNFVDGLLQHTGLDSSALPRYLGGNFNDEDIGAVEAVPQGAAASFE